MIPAPAGLQLAWRAAQPMQQCLVVHFWMSLVCGWALPLAALQALERRARRSFALAAAAGAPGREDPPEVPLSPPPSLLGSLFTLYLHSCLAWASSSTLEAL